jgi:hypothetical protein
MSNIIININHQSGILLLSMFYIYFLSDLFIVINEGPNYKLILKLCIPIWGKIIVEFIKFIEKYSVELHEWWNQTMSTELIISYVFKFIRWIYNNGIHQYWDLSMKYCLHFIFSYITLKIFYNFIFLFNFSMSYLIFSLLCTYSVYMKFDTSKTALVTLSGKCIEMGTGIILSEQLKLIDDWKDYCLKNKGTWLTYIIKLVIGYHGSTDIDGEQMALEISDYVGVSCDECIELYKRSLVKKMTSVVEVSKNVYDSISSKFLNNEEISKNN